MFRIIVGSEQSLRQTLLSVFIRKTYSQVNTPHNPKKIANKRFIADLC